METSKAATVQEYLDGLSPERREMVQAVREVILEHLPDGYEEGVQYGMIGYYVPLERYPTTYNKQPLGIAGLGSQKNYVSLYLYNVYADEGAADWFVEDYRASGKKLNMGKSCVRFKKLDDLPLDVIGRAIAHTSVDELIETYERSRRK